MNMSHQEIKQLEYEYYREAFKNETFCIESMSIVDDNFEVSVVFKSNDKLNVPLILLDRFFQYIGYIAVNYQLRKNNQSFRYLLIKSTCWKCLRTVRPERSVVVKGTLVVKKTTHKKKILLFNAYINRSMEASSELHVFI